MFCEHIAKKLKKLYSVKLTSNSLKICNELLLLVIAERHFLFEPNYEPIMDGDQNAESFNRWHA